ncbi:hypothetical protein V5799_014456 [Amblyomma americanum]|uniref:Beta-lactamase-like protein 2 homolog n=1 Tax=Amblyomma americanum TaxID=6943 RepID=A0AAQ4E2Z5_AMBAM
MATFIPKVATLTSRIIRVLGCNPGPMTLQGTNTYIIGTGKERILLDTGNPDVPEYIATLKDVLLERGISLQQIIVTHWHLDHVGGVDEILRQIQPGCKVKKYAFHGDKAEHSFQYLKDGEWIRTEGASLKVIATPGHTQDHIVLYLDEENALFSGDCILGEGSAVFEDFHSYMDSLSTILAVKPSVIYPGHGPVISNPEPKIREYIEHRLQREKQIIECLSNTSAEHMSAMDIVKEVYKGTPEHLHAAAARNVEHHLEKLIKDGKSRLPQKRSDAGVGGVQRFRFRYSGLGGVAYTVRYGGTMSYKNRSTFATLPRTQRGMPLVLGGDPKGKNFLYTNGNSVIIRDIANPSLCDIYTEHSQMTTVAKYSPSGFYIASADQTGKIRIWDTVQKEHILKNEFQPFVGIVKDVSWSPDSQRIMVVGEGRERFGHVFMAETGTSVGEIGGHSKQINSCDFRPTRPFRIITGSEDNTVGIYEGPPFKYKLTISDHTRFVQSVRYSPNGELFASGGFDGKMFLYNASTYEKVGEFGSPAHSGGIYAVSWSPDNTKILTASGDKTCKIWDASTLSVVTEFVMGSDVMDQQVSCLWQGDYLLSVSLSGFINYLDINNPEKPLRVIKVRASYLQCCKWTHLRYVGNIFWRVLATLQVV